MEGPQLLDQIQRMLTRQARKLIRTFGIGLVAGRARRNSGRSNTFVINALTAVDDRRRGRTKRCGVALKRYLLAEGVGERGHLRVIELCRHPPHHAARIRIATRLRLEKLQLFQDIPGLLPSQRRIDGRYAVSLLTVTELALGV